MKTQQTNANRFTDGFKLGRLSRLQALLARHSAEGISRKGAKTRSGNPWRLGVLARGVSSPSCLLPTFRSSSLGLFTLFLLAGTAQGGQKATGGDTITLTGGYWVHTFTTVGTNQFTPTNGDMSVQYLVVAGGGGGGGDTSWWRSGGGGAGGLLTSVIGCYSGGGSPGVGSTPNVSPALAASTPYTVTVGAGGNGAGGAGSGSDGGDSVFGNTGNEFARAKGGGGGSGGGAASRTGRFGDVRESSGAGSLWCLMSGGTCL